MNCLITAAVLIFVYAAAQDPGCEFFQNVEVNVTYYIYSPKFPQNYDPGVHCRWIGICPEGYNCRVDCKLVMPMSIGCRTDSLVILTSGDLTEADAYCGTGSLSVVSTGRSIIVDLHVSRSSQGGNFICDLTAQPAQGLFTPAPTQ